MLKALVFLLSLLTVACATTHPGTLSESNEKTVTVSILKNTELSDKYYYFYEYTIENMTGEWKDIQIKNTYFEGQQTEILTDDKLSSWIEGAELKLKKANYNRDLLLGSIVAVGGVAAMTSSNTNVQTAGAGAAVGAVVASGAIDLSRAKQTAVSGTKGLNQTVNVPQSHVLVPSKIAPESYIKRWVVVRAPQTGTAKAQSAIEFSSSYYQSQKLVTTAILDSSKEVSFNTMVQTSSF
jgi:hypothetical protein